MDTLEKRQQCCDVIIICKSFFETPINGVAFNRHASQSMWLLFHYVINLRFVVNGHKNDNCHCIQGIFNWLIFILEIVNGIVSPEKEVLPSADDAIDVSPVKGMSIKTDMRCRSSY